MKVNLYKMTIVVMDFEGHDLDKEEIAAEICNHRHFSIQTVGEVKQSEILNWSDNHPANFNDTYEQTVLNLDWK